MVPMTFIEIIRAPQRMITNDFVESVTFSIVPPLYGFFILTNALVSETL